MALFNCGKHFSSQYSIVRALCVASVLEATGALTSYAWLGNPYNNAQAEAAWNTLKTELLPYNGVFASIQEAHLEVAHCLDTYLNLDRHHSALDYHFPR